MVFGWWYVVTHKSLSPSIKSGAVFCRRKISSSAFGAGAQAARLTALTPMPVRRESCAPASHRISMALAKRTTMVDHLNHTGGLLTINAGWYKSTRWSKQLNKNGWLLMATLSQSVGQGTNWPCSVSCPRPDGVAPVWNPKHRPCARAADQFPAHSLLPCVGSAASSLPYKSRLRFEVLWIFPGPEQIRRLRRGVHISFIEIVAHMCPGQQFLQHLRSLKLQEGSLQWMIMCMHVYTEIYAYYLLMIKTFTYIYTYIHTHVYVYLYVT